MAKEVAIGRTLLCCVVLKPEMGAIIISFLTGTNSKLSQSGVRHQRLITGIHGPEGQSEGSIWRESLVD